jgi:large subunit ribosomal protein L10
VALKLEQKKQVVQEVNQVASEAISAVVVDYRGMTMSAMMELRRRALTLNVHVRVVRNTLAKRAVQETSVACLDSELKGQVILLFAMDHPGAAARLAKEFAKKYKNLEIKALAYDGGLLPVAQLAMLADLPTHDEAISLLMALLLAPVAQTTRALSETVARLARVTAAVAEQQESNG